MFKCVQVSIWLLKVHDSIYRLSNAVKKYDFQKWNNERKYDFCAGNTAVKDFSPQMYFKPYFEALHLPRLLTSTPHTPARLEACIS